MTTTTKILFFFFWKMIKILFFLCLLATTLAENQCNIAKQVTDDKLDSLDHRADKSHFRFVHYNADFLFWPKLTDDWPDAAQTEAHLDATVSLLRSLDADMIDMAEVHNCTTVSELARRLNTAQNSVRSSNSDSLDSYRAYLVPGTDSATGQNVAVLSRIEPAAPVRRSEARVSYPLPGSRCCGEAGACGEPRKSKGVSKHLYTLFKIGGMRVALFVVHFLAHPDNSLRCQQREAQASVVADLVRSVVADAEAAAGGRRYSVILCGDMNDYDETVADAAGSEPMSRVLSILRDYDQTRDGDELVNVVALKPIKSQDDAYSAWWDKNHNDVDDGTSGGEHTTIDHVLVSRDLAKHIKSVRYDHSYSQNTLPRVYSDHWPIVVDFEDVPSFELPLPVPVTAAVIITGLVIVLVSTVVLLLSCRRPSAPPLVIGSSGGDDNDDRIVVATDNRRESTRPLRDDVDDEQDIDFQ
jgi:exonuclease III